MPGSKTALGIDITDERISMALLRKSGDSIRLLKAAECPVPEGSVKNGNIEDPVALAKAIKTLKTRNRMYSNRCAMSLTANPVLAQILDLPKDVTGNIRQFINNEVKHYAVLPIKKAVLDFCKIKSSAALDNRRVLIVATDGQKISTFAEALYKKDISINAIEPSWMAYTRACFDKIISNKLNTNLLFATINKGVLTLSMFKDQKLDFVRIQPVELAEIESVTFLDWLAEQINAVIKFYEYGKSSQHNKWMVNIYTPERYDFLLQKQEVLQSSLIENVSVEIKTSETAYLDTPVVADNIKNKPSAAAIGLAMKLLIYRADDLNINLVPEQALLAKSREKKTLIIANFAASLLVIMILSILFFNTKIAKVKADAYKQNENLPSEDTKLMLDKQNVLDTKIEKLSGKLNNIMSIVKTDSVTNWGSILNEISIAIPKDTRLTSIRNTGSDLLLLGQSRNYDAIYLFVDSLNKSEYIKSAKIIETTNNSQSKGLVNYSIKCVLTQ